MSLRDYRRIELTSFAGARPFLDPTDILPPHAREARNVEFETNRVRSRYGHRHLKLQNDAPLVSNGKVVGLYGWTTAGFDILVRHDNGKVEALVRAPFEAQATWFEQPAEGMVCASAGVRLYIATFGADLLGSGSAHVVDATEFPGVYAIKAFSPPTPFIPNVTEASGGRVTPGTHRVGYAWVSRSGFIGRLCPEVSGNFSPVPVTVTANKKISFSMTVNIPSWAKAMRFVMTTADNPHKFYFVPGLEFAVPPGASNFPINVLIDISDEEILLAGSDLDASDHRYLVTQDQAGNAPFNPSMVLAYGQRMVYLANDRVWISDPGKFEHLTEDENYVALPGLRRACAATVLRGVLYLLGPYWTYAVEDNGDRPATWHQPILVDGQKGAWGPNTIAPDPTGGYAWIANESGLYLFTGGAFPDIPISYYQTPIWNRINPAAIHTIQIVDNHVAKRLEMLVPLDDATSPSHILVWDYHDGRDPDSVRFSIWSLQSYSPRTIALVKDKAKQRLLRYLGPASSGRILIEDAVVNDDGAAIESVYESAPLPPEGARHTMNAIHAYLFRLVGNGNLRLKTYSVDRDLLYDAYPAPLNTTPGKDLVILTDIVAEQASFEVSMADQPDGWWSMIRADVFWSPHGSVR